MFFLYRLAPLCAPRLICGAHRPEAILRRPRSAFYYLQLLSSFAHPGHGTPPRLVSEDPGRSTATLSVCGVWIRDHAGAFPPADQRAGAGRSVGGDESGETEV